MTADSAGGLWVTFVRTDRSVTHTLEHDTSWSAPIALASAAAAVDLVDVSSIVAFGPGRIGVMWTNQLSGIYFSVHEDGAPDDSWSEPETVLTGQRNDDALSVVPYPLADGGIGVAAAVGTSLERSLDPGTLLATRARMEHGTRRSSVSSAIASRDRSSRRSRGDDHRRGCDIARQRRGDLLQAIAARPDPLRHRRRRPAHREPDRHHHRRRDIEQGSALREAGLLVLASDRTSGRYLHGVVDLGAGPPAADPADLTARRVRRPAPDDVTATLLRDTFEPWPKGPTGAAGWYVRPEDGAAPLSIVTDGGKARP